MTGHYDALVEDTALLAALRQGDERAFRELVARYQTSLVRVARYYVNSDATAEDVVQDTWLGVLRGLDRFEGRSSVKTWLFHILVNRARTTGQREHRTVPVDPQHDTGIAAQRFNEGGMWRDPPTPFTDTIDDALAQEDLVALVRVAVARLPEPQRSVVTLRDAEGLSTSEVADLLALTEANVRVILHRGRTRVRADVESSVRGGVK